VRFSAASRHSKLLKPCNDRGSDINGVQGVGGSNPLVPTSFLNGLATPSFPVRNLGVNLGNRTYSSSLTQSEIRQAKWTYQCLSFGLLPSLKIQALDELGGGQKSLLMNR